MNLDEMRKQLKQKVDDSYTELCNEWAESILPLEMIEDAARFVAASDAYIALTHHKTPATVVRAFCEMENPLAVVTNALYKSRKSLDFEQRAQNLVSEVCGLFPAEMKKAAELKQSEVPLPAEGMLMSLDDITEALRKKLDINMDALLDEMIAKPSDVIYGRAKEIAAASEVYNLLYGADREFSAEGLEYLLRFENPLKVVRDAWMNNQGFDRRIDMEVMLGHLATTRDAEYEYDLDEDFLDPLQQHEQKPMQ